MNLAVSLLIATALSLSLPLAGAHRRVLADSPPAPPPQSFAHGSRRNLTYILAPGGRFQTFVMYLQQTGLVEVFEIQAHRTHHGITILVPTDRAFAAIEPSVLSGLKKHQVKSLMMYHALARHYALKEFDALSRVSPVTTFAGGLYTVNVTYDAGAIRVVSSWADAKVVRPVYEMPPMAVYEIDRVLLPDAIFHAQPAVEAIPPSPDGTTPPSDGDATKTPGGKAGGTLDAKSSACRALGRAASYVIAAALCAVAL
ncbi:fasciclin-like arabinogalactan protein 7 [Brachypodium distachyon]|uniref:FAS1 domain-containing protein n=1 Tax=Brachypodium distachyon TaxID=15368 RepID=A0A0Q3KSJ4_BRADI|nr:fasciclin-like arabinogalactan protein 7 [Brachypodium distachyon]KQJ83109.1 hypothetical protein BRADI_5g13100v3 [Brachypodium distachyon]|eukprot:XP_003581343.1 fasciclin-like arabinogalactan protein 7 [Brachypodium distachyon]